MENKTLRCYMNLMALDSLPESSRPAQTREEQFAAIRESGFQGVQFSTRATPHELAICRSLKLGIAGSGRVNTPAEAFKLAADHADGDYDCVTLHAGWGLEDDTEACRLIQSVLEASFHFKTPLYFETHRATICQDMWRTVDFVRRFPEMRFNGDFSHWYTGQEMVYGGFDRKFAFIQPVIERVRFLHGRVADPGCIQVEAREGTTYLAHFQQLWTACFQAFLQNTGADDFICFTPELLGPHNYYARASKGREETNRWSESLRLNEIARKCFANARAMV